MARRITLDVITDAEQRGLVEAAAGLDRLANRVDGTGDQMRQMSAEANRASARIAEFGRDSARSAASAAILAHEIDRVQGNMRGLAAVMAHGDLSVANTFRAERARLAQLKQISAELGNDEKTGRGVGAAIGDIAEAIPLVGRRLAGVIAQIPPQISIPIVIGGAAATLAVAGAAATGAALAATGLGGLAAGIVAQLQDPSVKAAATDLGAWLKTELMDASSSFAMPLKAGFGYLREDLRPVLADLRGDFASLAPYVSALLDGVGKLAQQVAPGLSEALRASGPVLEELGRDLPLLGYAASQFFSALADGAKGGTEGLHAMILLIASMTITFGQGLDILAHGFDFIIQGADRLFQILAKIPGQAPLWKPIADQVHDIATSFDGAGLSASDFTGRTDLATSATQDLTAALAAEAARFDDLFGRLIGVDQVTLAYNDAVRGVTESVKQNGASLDQSTAAGSANANALLSGAQAADRMRQANIANGMSADQANGIFRDQINQLGMAAIKAGEDANQVWGLIGALRNIPLNITTRVSTIYTITNDTRPGQTYSQQRYGGIVHAAQGLVSGVLPPRQPGTLVMAGEPGTGGEVFMPLRGISRARAMSLAGVVGAAYGFPVGGRRTGGGGNNYTINVTAPVGAQAGTVGAAVVDAIKAFERSNGAGWRAA